MLPRLLGYDADTREVTREVLGEWLKKNEGKPFIESINHAADHKTVQRIA